MASPVETTLRLPELLEHILLGLLDDLVPVNDQEDPRSAQTHNNAQKLLHLLRCSEVSQTWNQYIKASKPIQRALFLCADYNLARSWLHDPQAEQIRPRSYYRAPSLRAPTLNAMVQTIFPTYHFRFWHLSLEASGNKHCAYIIITRRDLPKLERRANTGQGRTISRMLLSQPPCTELEAMIWEERDESQEYVCRTLALRDPVVRRDEGLTIGFVHQRVAEMFAEHQDVAAIKLTTM
jgi:hypothetical protein